MKCLVTGCGRCGSNLLTEAVRATDKFMFTQHVEDRGLFSKIVLPARYATKLTTEHESWSKYKYWSFLKEHNFVVFVSTRHPIAAVMSKIVRGQPKSKGGDTTEEKCADDATVESAVAALYDSAFKMISVTHAGVPVHTIKMESLIVHTEFEMKYICEQVQTEFNEGMLEFAKENRNKYQKERYGNKLDKEQACVVENWKTAYNGFFADKKDTIAKIQTLVEPLIEMCGYGKVEL